MEEVMRRKRFGVVTGKKVVMHGQAMHDHAKVRRMYVKGT